MPRTYLTQQDRINAAVEKKQDAVADALAVFKRRHNLTNEQIGSEIGVGMKTMSKIMRGEPVELKTDAYWRLLLLLRFDVAKREESA